MASVTAEQVRSVMSVVTAVAQAIHDAGSLIDGHLYATLSGVVSLSEYELLIAKLVEAKLVRRDPGHLLTWIGPK